MARHAHISPRDEQYARLWPQFRDTVSPHGHEQQQSTFFYTTISIIMPFGTIVVIYIMYRLPFLFMGLCICIDVLYFYLFSHNLLL
jgi:hypothetical protein